MIVLLDISQNKKGMWDNYEGALVGSIYITRGLSHLLPPPGYVAGLCAHGQIGPIRLLQPMAF